MDILKALKGEESKLLKKAQAIRAAMEILGENSSVGNGRKKHHTMSAAARARIGRATRLRWKKFRAAKKNA